jgi:sodium pump decarboxylase gamma subunit
MFGPGRKPAIRRHTMIINGLTITVIGMAIVFGFLIILVLAMLFLNYILRTFFPKSLEVKPEGKRPVEAAATAAKDETAVVAAAVAAIKAHIAMNRG